MTKPISIAIVGAGDVVRRFYQRHLPDVPGLHLRGILSRQIDSARRLAAAAHIECVYATLAELLDDAAVRGVIVCVPPAAQHEIVAKSLDAGRHVLVEKPVCVTEAEIEDLVARAQFGPGTLHVTFNNRFREENAALRQAVLDGAVGDPVLMNFEWLRRKPRPVSSWGAAPEQAIGGVLADLGSHLVAMLVEMLPRRRRFRLFAQFGRDKASPDGIEDVAQLLIQMDGVSAVIQVGWNMVLAQSASVSLRVVGTAGERASGDYQGPKSDGYMHVLTRFAKHAAVGVSPDLDLALDTMRIVHAAYRSAKTGLPVEGEFAVASPHGPVGDV